MNAPGCNPAASVTAPDSQAVQAVLTAGTATIAAALGHVLTSLQAALSTLMSTVKDAISKAATSIVTPLNQVQTVVDLASARAVGSPTGQLAAARLPTGTGGAVGSGVVPWQYQFNVWQSIDVPSSVYIFNRAYQPNPFPQQLCFRGGWDLFSDAVTYKTQIMTQPLPEGCKLPGGPAVTAPRPIVAPPCDTNNWYWYEIVENGTIIGCAKQCGNANPVLPTGQIHGPLFGPVSEQIADETIALICGSPPISTHWYAGCDASGHPVTWLEGAQPANVTQISGPYPDQATALALSVCAVINPPPPPPPPPTSTGSCCDPTTGKVALPDCIKIDLCDWDAFADAMQRAIYKALCQWIQDPACNCPTRDSDRWIAEDCDGELTNMVSGWMGRIGGPVVTASSADDLVAAAVSGQVYAAGLLGDSIDPPE